MFYELSCNIGYLQKLQKIILPNYKLVYQIFQSAISHNGG
jgi:hypothetical protein